MKELSENELQVVRRELLRLEGLSLREMWRYAGYQVFEFAKGPAEWNPNGNGYSVSAVCEWRLAGPELFRLGSWNFARRGRRHDGHAHRFYHWVTDFPLAVNSAEVDALGGIYIGLAEGFSIELHPELAKRGDGDQWRIMSREDCGSYDLTLTNSDLTYMRWDSEDNEIQE